VAAPRSAIRACHAANRKRNCNASSGRVVPVWSSVHERGLTNVKAGQDVTVTVVDATPKK
jgi:hypothetical protein